MFLSRSRGHSAWKPIRTNQFLILGTLRMKESAGVGCFWIHGGVCVVWVFGMYVFKTYEYTILSQDHMHVTYIPQWEKYMISVLLIMNSIYSKNGKKEKKLPMGRRRKTSNFH